MKLASIAAAGAHKRAVGGKNGGEAGAGRHGADFS